MIPIASSPTQYPRAVREVHQIEVTTHCNLRCHYCPHYPKLPRPKIFMEWETYEQALALVSRFVKAGTQTEVALTGIGESLLHPRFVDMVAALRAVLGEVLPITFSTNGILLTEELCAKLQPYNPRIYVSMHRPEKAAPAAHAAQKYGLLSGINNSFVTSSFDWGGKVDWYVTAPKIQCEYLRSGWCVVLADGSITNCCLDADGAGIFGHVKDADNLEGMKPFSLCQSCHMQVP